MAPDCKSLPRCRRGRGCRDTAAEEEHVLWQEGGEEEGVDQKQEEEKGDLADAVASISGGSREETGTTSAGAQSLSLSLTRAHTHHYGFH